MRTWYRICQKKLKNEFSHKSHEVIWRLWWTDSFGHTPSRWLSSTSKWSLLVVLKRLLLAEKYIVPILANKVLACQFYCSCWILRRLALWKLEYQFLSLKTALDAIDCPLVSLFTRRLRRETFEVFSKWSIAFAFLEWFLKHLFWCWYHRKHTWHFSFLNH